MVLKEYIIGYEFVHGEEHVVDSTSVDAENDEQAIDVARELAEEFYPNVDPRKISIAIVEVREIGREDLEDLDSEKPSPTK